MSEAQGVITIKVELDTSEVDRQLDMLVRRVEKATKGLRNLKKELGIHEVSVEEKISETITAASEISKL